MAIRFRKSFTLAPGVRMFLSPRGVSGSFGPRGSSVSVGRQGVYGNAGLPGTGLSMRQKLSGTQPQARSANRASRTIEMPLSIGVGDDGILFFQDGTGAPLADHLVAIAKRQHGDTIKALIQRKCDAINAEVEAVGELHLDTPEPTRRPAFVAQDYDKPRPTPPEPKAPGLLDKLFASRRDRLDAENRAAAMSFEEETAEWKAGLAEHRAAEAIRRHFIEELIYSDPEAMEAHLEHTLQTIAWPRETLVAAAILDAGRTVYIDVDLPEIEDMPDRTAGVPQRGMKLSIKTMSPTQVQKLYMRHVHAVAFRIIGEIFSAFPIAETVVSSGYSQRRDKATGQLGDEYLYSVRVVRSDWQRIDFTGLDSIDVTDALQQFELRRNMTKTGRFKPISPFTAT